MSRLPDTLLVAPPDDDALVIGAGHDAAILPTTTTARGELSPKCLDILGSRAACIRPTISPTSSLQVVVDLSSFKRPEVLGIHRLGLCLVLNFAVW
jgi:hypothetical protein